MSVIAEAFDRIGKPLPTTRGLCVYRAGILDSFELMQLVLELELLSGTKVDLEKLFEGAASIDRLEQLVRENGR